jgi:hypothetical protein
VRSSKPEKLFTFSSGGWVVLLAAFFMLVAAGLVFYPVFVNGLHPSIGDGRHVDTYGFDLSSLTIPREELVASGLSKDGIDAIPSSLVETITPAEVDRIAEKEHIRFLVPADRVIGLEINGETRTYPVRVLNLHELVNDTVGGVPVAVTWTPLCGGVVVFDRRMDGESAAPVEFGVSGLLVNSNSVFFDRRKDPRQESLWPQLALRAISGPAAGRAMIVVPFELTTWGEWRAKHPETRVLIGLRRRMVEYGSEPYNTYLHNDDVKFPVNPLWNDPKVRRKTQIVVTSADGRVWTAATLEKQDAVAPRYRIYSFLFAWYAQHPNDTDYSALTK